MEPRSSEGTSSQAAKGAMGTKSIFRSRKKAAEISSTKTTGTPVSKTSTAVQEKILTSGFLAFKDSSLIFTKEAPIFEYETSMQIRDQLKYPRLRILLADLVFLTYYWNIEEIPEPVILYIGGAPGYHLPLLSELFPSLRWVCYDSGAWKVKPSADYAFITKAEFADKTQRINLQKKSRIIFITEDFDDSDLPYWSKQKNVFLISQLNLNKNNEYLEPQEFDIVYGIPELRQQAIWYREIKPLKASLKFRPPYYFPGMVRNLAYFEGTLIKEVWAGSRATETRLVPASTKLIDYDLKWYEGALYHYNIVERSDNKYLVPFELDPTISTKPIASPDLLNDYDSTASVFVAGQYLSRTLKNFKPVEAVNLILNLVSRLTGGKNRLYNLRRSQAEKTEETVETIPTELKQSPEQAQKKEQMITELRVVLESG